MTLQPPTEQMRTLITEMAGQTDQLHQCREEVALILAVQQGVRAELDTDAVYELVGDRIRDFFDAQVVVIRTFDLIARHDHVRYVSEKGRRLHPGVLALSRLQQHVIDTHAAILWKENVAARLASYGHPIFDESEMPKSVLSVPMIVQGVVRGAISLQNVDREYAFDESDLAVLTALACSMGQALETAETHIRLRETLRDLRTTRDQLLEEQQMRTQAAETLNIHLREESRRQVRELDEARDFQLSLLPAGTPDIPHLEIAAYMRTATEVGGDYYDFFVSDGNVLTFAVGDAAGHGMRAGSMVTAVKSLLTCYRDEPDLAKVLDETSEVLREIALPGLFMAMALGRLKEGDLVLAGAGMPPALLRRAATGEVEQLSLKGMPLAGMVGYPYATRTLRLERGDTLVLMSDGFAESFNERGAMLGYARAAQVLKDAGDVLPEHVVRHFVDVIDRWVPDGGLQDDMTFVVLRMHD